MESARRWRVACVVLAGLVAQPSAAQQVFPFNRPPIQPVEVPPAPMIQGELPEALVGPLRARLQERLDAHREAVGAPGASLAIVLPGGQELAVCSGLARRGDDASVLTSGDRMPSGSIGKTYCAAMAMLLAGEGLLALDEPIATVIGDRPWFGRLPNAAAITPRMLLNHTSGLREHVTSPEFTAALRADPWREWTPEELAAFALDQEPLFEAGKGWSYADTNYIVLGVVIEAATGRAYNELLRERLLEPLGLVWTDPMEGPELWGLIPGYTDPENPFGFPEQTAESERYCVNPQFEYTGGGTITTAPDLARWADHLYGGRVVSPEALVEMADGVDAPRLGQGVRYGLGTIIWPSPHGVALGHSGWFPGFVSTMCRYQDLGISIAYQQNSDVRANPAAMRRLLDGVAGVVSSTLAIVPKPEPAEEAEEPGAAVGPG